MPDKILEGCQRQNDVQRTVFWPMTGPQVKFSGIYLRKESRIDERLEIARNLLTEGSSFEFVHEITGLDIDTLKGLQEGL
jgi:hypothetical protein